MNYLRRWLTVPDAVAVQNPKDDIPSVVKDTQKRLRNASPRGVSVERPGKRVTKEYVGVTDGSPGSVFETRSASSDESGRGWLGSADRGWLDDGGVESRISSRDRAKPRQMDYGRADTSFERDADVCYVCHPRAFRS